MGRLSDITVFYYMQKTHHRLISDHGGLWWQSSASRQVAAERAESPVYSQA
jgi:hypothetical protein